MWPKDAGNPPGGSVLMRFVKYRGVFPQDLGLEDVPRWATHATGLGIQRIWEFVKKKKKEQF